MSQESVSPNRYRLTSRVRMLRRPLPPARRLNGQVRRVRLRTVGPVASFAEETSERFFQVLSSIAWLLAAASAIGAAEPLAPVIVATVIERDVGAGHRAVGTVRPLRTSTIGSAADGRVLEFLVQVGDAVAKGQPLAKLGTDTLKIEVAAAEAELDLFEHQLAELRNGARPEEIVEAQANLLGAKSAMESAAKSLRRIRALAESRATSASDLDGAVERAELTRHTHSATEALLNRIKQGPRVEQIAQASARVELQTQRINLIIDRIGKFTIRAPFAGYVAEEYTEVGAWMSQGDPVVRVIQLDEVEVEAPITAEYAVHLQRGDTIRVEFPALPDNLVMGTVDRVVPVADERARTFPAFVRLTNQFRDATPLFMSGMFVRVVLPSVKKERMPLVPKDALVLNAAKRSIYVFENDSGTADASPSPTSDLTSASLTSTSLSRENREKGKGGEAASPGEGPNRGDPNRDRSLVGTVREVPVALGVAVDDRIQVRGDVSADDLVVVVGNERLKDGDRVTIQGYYAGDSAATSGERAATTDAIGTSD